MAHPSYQDEPVNGVAVSYDPIIDEFERYYVNSQVGEDLVPNPEATPSRRKFCCTENFPGYTNVLATSNQALAGQLLMSNAQMVQLQGHLNVIDDHFEGLYSPGPDEPFAMEIEFKITSENILAIEQARPWVFDVVYDTTTPPPAAPPPPPPPPVSPPSVSGSSGGSSSGAGGKQRASRNRSPEFREGRRAERIIAENTPAGTPIGDPVEARDSDDREMFAVDAATGQLFTG